MAFEVVPTAAGRLHSDQYTKIIIINTPINLRVFPWSNILSFKYRYMYVLQLYLARAMHLLQ